MDILLIKETMDAAFTNGAIPVTDEVRQSVAQRLTIKLSTFLAEWFLTQDYGIDYIGQFMGRKRSKNALDVLIQSAILEEPLVESIASFSSEIDSSRTYSVYFQVVVSSGEVTEPITINLGL